VSERNTRRKSVRRERKRGRVYYYGGVSVCVRRNRVYVDEDVGTKWRRR
jgi:hypothetical protein